MKKHLYRAICTLVLLLMVSQYTQEADRPSKTFYTVGNYIIIEQKGLFKAHKGELMSGWHERMYKSIKEIQKP